jgi:type I restriction enzyme S subunit
MSVMSKGWRKVALGDVLRIASIPEVVHPERSYPNLGIYGFGRGVFTKPNIEGQETSAKILYKVSAGQFIYSRLFAFEGAYAVVPATLDGAYVSNEFPTFDWNTGIANPRFVAWVFKRPSVWAAIAEMGVGMGDRRKRVHPDSLLSYSLKLPPLHMQHDIVERLDAVSMRLKARAETAERQKADLTAMLRALIKIDANPVRLGKLLTQRPVDVSVEKTSHYQFAGVYSFGRGVFLGQRKAGSDFAYPRLTTLHSDDFTYPKLMAWEGAFGIVPPECDGCVVSSEFPVFAVDQERISSDILAIHFSDPQTWRALSGGSTGTNARRRRLHPDNLLAYEMPVPSPQVQKLVALLMPKVRALRTHQTAIATDADALLPSMLNQIFG